MKPIRDMTTLADLAAREAERVAAEQAAEKKRLEEISKAWEAGGRYIKRNIQRARFEPARRFGVKINFAPLLGKGK